MRDPSEPPSEPPSPASPLPPLVTTDPRPAEPLPGEGIPVVSLGVATEESIPATVPVYGHPAIREAFRAYRAAHPATPPGALLTSVGLDAYGSVVALPPESIYGPGAQPVMGRAAPGGDAVVIQPPVARAAARGAAPAPAGHFTPEALPTPSAPHVTAPHAPRVVSAPPLPAESWGAFVDAPARGRLLPVIGFAGPRGSGKDAAALGCLSAPRDGSALALPPGWVTVALADDLKRRVAFAFGVPWANLTGPSRTREQPVPVYADWRDRWPVVFGPALFADAWPAPGAPGANTPALRDAIDAATADVWEVIAAELDRPGEDGAQPGTPEAAKRPGTISARRLLQWIGTDYARRVRDDVWIERLWATYAALCAGAGYRRTAGVVDVGPCYWPPGLPDPPRPAAFLPLPHDGDTALGAGGVPGVVCGSASPLPAGVLLSDVRFPDEVRALTGDGPRWVQPGAWRHGAVWWIDADGAPWCPPRMAHASEPEYADLAPFVTGVIPNRPETGDLAAFTRRVLGHVHGFLDGLPPRT